MTGKKERYFGKQDHTKTIEVRREKFGKVIIELLFVASPLLLLLATPSLLPSPALVLPRAFPEPFASLPPRVAHERLLALPAVPPRACESRPPNSSRGIAIRSKVYSSTRKSRTAYFPTEK